MKVIIILIAINYLMYYNNSSHKNDANEKPNVVIMCVILTCQHNLLEARLSIFLVRGHQRKGCILLKKQ